MKRFTAICLLLVLIRFSVDAQRTSVVYYSVEEAVAKPREVLKFYLDCEVEDDSLFFTSLDKLTNLKSLTIVGYSNERFPDKIPTSLHLDSLFISECYNLDFPRFFKWVSRFRELKCLVIDECDLSEVGSEIAGMPQLSKLVITNCGNLNLERSISNIASCKSLKYLGLPVNQICEIPMNIGMVNQIEVLDISNNIVFELPESMSSMEMLQSFMAEGNIFVNPVNALSNLNPLKIKYLSIDSDISEGDMARLKQLFPDAVIEGVDAYSDETLSDETLPEDTSISNGIRYGEFNSVGVGNRIYSEAYLHYANVFGSPRTVYDSLLFDERYKDLSYANVYRITNPSAMNVGSSPALFSWKRKWMQTDKKRVAFNFYLQGESYLPNTIIENKELAAFRGMYWIYDGDLTKKEFDGKYRVFRSLKEVSRMGSGFFWTDVRIYYDDISKEFTLELKSRNGFESFYAHPVLESTKNPELSKEQYNKRFARYLKSLDSRRRRFDTKLLRDKAVYKRNRDKISNRQWKEFAENYFSEEEKKMTREQWLEYYDQVIGEEKTALELSSVTVPLLNRYLYVNRFVENIGNNSLMFDSTAWNIGLNFFDKNNIKQVVATIFTLNILNRTFTSRVGSLGLMPNMLTLGKSANIGMIAIMRNGDVGLLRPQDYVKIDLSTTVNDVQLEVIRASLVTYKQIADILGF